MTDICSICREPIFIDEILETKCHHLFHKECLINYCKYMNLYIDINFSFINCPICKTMLNCRINDGIDIKTYIPPVKHSFTNIEKALHLIPEEEYEFIDTIDDIYLPEIPLTVEEKTLLLQKIKKKVVSENNIKNIKVNVKQKN